MPAVSTNVDLIVAAARNHIPLNGIFFKNRLPALIKDGGYIFNLADDTDAEGTHWTAAWVEPDTHGKKQVVYFDPFGFAPPENVKLFFKVIDPTLHYSKKVVQNIDSFICGYFVLYFLWYMHRMASKERNIFQRMRDFLSLWSEDVKDNRSRLEKYLRALN